MHNGTLISDLQSLVNSVSPDLSSASPSAGEVNQRFAEVIWDGECWVVVLWHGFEARLSAGEQEFPELGSDAKNYIKSFCDDGKVIF